MLGIGFKITRIVGPVTGGTSPVWIMNTGFWDDAGVWDDADVWAD